MQDSFFFSITRNDVFITITNINNLSPVGFGYMNLQHHVPYETINYNCVFPLNQSNLNSESVKEERLPFLISERHLI